MRETLTAVQQLERSMSKLREWLAHMERELGGPLAYHTPDRAQIQRHLTAIDKLVGLNAYNIFWRNLLYYKFYELLIVLLS